MYIRMYVWTCLVAGIKGVDVYVMPFSYFDVRIFKNIYINKIRICETYLLICLFICLSAH